MKGRLVSFHMIVARRVPDERGHQGPQTEEGDHERIEGLRELPPHTSPLLVVLPFSRPTFSLSLLVLLLLCTALTFFLSFFLNLSCPAACALGFLHSDCCTSQHLTRTRRSVKTVNDYFFFLLHVCLLSCALITPASLATSLPVWLDFAFVDTQSFACDFWLPLRQVCSLLLFISSLHSWGCSHQVETDRLLHILLESSPLLLCPSVFVDRSRTFFLLFVCLFVCFEGGWGCVP